MSLSWQFFNCSLTEPWVSAEWGRRDLQFPTTAATQLYDNGWVYEPFSISCLGRQMWCASTKIQIIFFFCMGMLHGIPWHRHKHLSAEVKPELNCTGLTTAMGPQRAEKGPSCWSNFRAYQITEYSELKLPHKDHQISLLALPGLKSHSACSSQKAPKGEAIMVHHLELVHQQVLVTLEQFGLCSSVIFI